MEKAEEALCGQVCAHRQHHCVCTCGHPRGHQHGSDPGGVSICSRGCTNRSSPACSVWSVSRCLRAPWRANECVCVCELFACTHVMGCVADCIHVILCMWVWFPRDMCTWVWAEEYAYRYKPTYGYTSGVGMSAHWSAHVCLCLCKCEPLNCRDCGLCGHMMVCRCVCPLVLVSDMKYGCLSKCRCRTGYPWGLGPVHHLLHHYGSPQPANDCRLPAGLYSEPSFPTYHGG